MNHSTDDSLLDLDVDDPQLLADLWMKVEYGILMNFSYNGSHDLDSDLNYSNADLEDGIPKRLLDPRLYSFRRVIHILDLYGVPVVVTIGILGNMTCFVVFMATYLRRLSSSIYLAALSITDALFLFTALCAWLDNVHIDIYHRPGWCQALTYLGFVTSFLDVWYVVSFTVERYLAVCFPFKRHELCSPRRAKIVVVSLAFLGCVMFNFAIWTSEVGYHFQRPFCAPLPRYFKLVSALNNVDTLITLIIPTILIIVSNIRIGYAVSKFYRNRVRLQRHVTEPPSDDIYDPSVTIVDTRGLYSNSSYNRQQMKVTKMLLIVSTVFLLCHIPSHGFRVYVFVMTLVVESYQPSHLTLLIQKLFQYIYIINFASNIFLYNLSGRTFRKAMIRLVRRMQTRVVHFFRTQYNTPRSCAKPHSTRYTREPQNDIIRMRQPENVSNCIHKRNSERTCNECAKYS